MPYVGSERGERAACLGFLGGSRGTFTDVVARRPDGSLVARKLLSEDPRRYDDAATTAIADLLDVPRGEPLPPERIRSVKMGTTVLIHPHAGMLSALGIGLADVTDLRAEPVEAPLDEDLIDELHRRLAAAAPGADGAEIVGDWDPIGMRGTDSRTLVMDDVFVPARNEVLPPGMFNAMVARFPQFYMSLTFSYLGLMRAILDATRAYLRGESGVKASRDHPIKQTGWAQLQLVYDRAQSLTYRVLSELRADPSPEELRRAHVATVTTMESAPEMASLALRTCGGRSLLRLGRNGLYDDPTDHD